MLPKRQTEILQNFMEQIFKELPPDNKSGLLTGHEYPSGEMGPGDGPHAMMIIRRIGTGIKWLRDSMVYIPDIREIYANEKRSDWPAYLPALLPGAQAQI